MPPSVGGHKRRGKCVSSEWANPLVVGRPLPTLPLWLNDDLAVPLELETSYEQACDLIDIK